MLSTTALSRLLSIQLLELKCKVHSLDGIAKKCRDVLKEYDTEKETTSDIFGLCSELCACHDEDALQARIGILSQSDVLENLYRYE